MGRKLVVGSFWLAGLVVLAAGASADDGLPDYEKLAAECKSGCCRASVVEMKMTGSTVHEPGKPCPPGTTANMFRCAESRSWCEPPKPKATPTPPHPQGPR